MAETQQSIKDLPRPVTIVIGNHMTVQGQFVKDTPDGKRIVRVGAHEFKGTAVEKA